MADLENLRNQAKLYLRWHRERYYPVAAQIRAALPSFNDLTDSEILDSRFDLSHAHELVARQSGFESWQALVAGLPHDTPESSLGLSPPFLMGIEAQLFVADVEASCNFFTTKLGFEAGIIYGEPPFFSQVRRDNALINLRLVCEPVYVGDIREREQLLAVSMTVDSIVEIKQLFEQYQAAHVDFFQPLKREPWGGLSFIVRDPDGNLLLFAWPTYPAP